MQILGYILKKIKKITISCQKPLRIELNHLQSIGQSSCKIYQANASFINIRLRIPIENVICSSVLQETSLVNQKKD